MDSQRIILAYPKGGGGVVVQSVHRDHGRVEPGRGRPMTVLLVDDHPITRAGMIGILQAMDGGAWDFIEVDGLGGALGALGGCPGVDLVILDLEIPGAHGCSGLVEIKRVYPDAPVVVMAASSDPRTILESYRCGAVGYLPKSLDPALIPHALRLVMSKGLYVPSDFLGLGEPGTEGASAGAGDTGGGESLAWGGGGRMTPRQNEILDLLVSGYSNKNISRQLGISLGTIKNHVAAILRVLSVSSRAQAISLVLSGKHRSHD